MCAKWRIQPWKQRQPLSHKLSSSVVNLPNFHTYVSYDVGWFRCSRLERLGLRTTRQYRVAQRLSALDTMRQQHLTTVSLIIVLLPGSKYQQLTVPILQPVLDEAVHPHHDQQQVHTVCIQLTRPAPQLIPAAASTYTARSLTKQFKPPKTLKQQ